MTDKNVTIRPFGAADTDELLTIWLDASLIAHAFIGEARLMEQRRLVKEHYLPRAETWVATIGSRPVGFISLLETFVGGLFVSPQQQGAGIGRRLVSHALKLKGELTLDVYTQNGQAMRFYHRLGFREVSRRPADEDGLPFENARLHRAG